MYGRLLILKNYNRDDNLHENYINCNYRVSFASIWSCTEKEFCRIDRGNPNACRKQDNSQGKISNSVLAGNNIIKADYYIAITLPLRGAKGLLIIAGMLLTGFAGYKSRHTGAFYMKKKFNALKKGNVIDKERLRISQDLHDHIGASLTRINLLCELGKRNKSGEILDKISQTTLDVIKTMDEIVWVISPQNDLLNNLVDYIIQYANEFFDGSGIKCRFNLPAIFPDEYVRHELRHNIFLTIKEALNNILKHSEADEVNLYINLINDLLEVEISDNGKGFDRSKSEKNGNGLNNMGKRITDLGGMYEISSKQNGGTKIKFMVSIKG